jgi:hypothetical protein
MIMHKNLFGENIVNSEETGRVKVGNKRVKVYKYTINMETAKYHEDIIKYSRWTDQELEDEKCETKEYDVLRREYDEEILPLLDTDKDEYYRKNKDWTMRRNHYLGIRQTTTPV